MFGHDMSWASFHVLEVMSSAKYVQKRVGYLGAVQSFRPDTEVLMLATNLLKKDLMSPVAQTVSLPLLTVPHVITPSLALSLLADILPRLTHSHPAIRKKTIATLYRLALVYPETLRPAWPKIKERLMDEAEDSSVTAAIINVVCELGWRRPQDFLALAPRLFDLLVEGGNNWMAIKIIKLFATLTPLEPRLVRKLLPPLTTIIRTTPAMSLLYECINGIIQGGILEGAEGTKEGDDVASLCVGKLRGMIVVEGDPNLKYVALLAFNKIVTSHPHLVSLHQDVILHCIDDADISIRMRALDLVVGMVNAENLASVIGRLMRQLRNSPSVPSAGDPTNDRGSYSGIQPAADSEDEDPEESLRPAEKKSDQPPPLPDDYKIAVLRRILEMCSRDTYANVSDFEWYIDILVQLVKYCPAFSSETGSRDAQGGFDDTTFLGQEEDVSHDIGSELRNVAVRVRAVRQEATAAADALVSVDRRAQLFPSSGKGGQGILSAAVWIVGEYAEHLHDAGVTLDSLIHPSNLTLPPSIMSAYLQAIPKVIAKRVHQYQGSYELQNKPMISLLMARVIHFLEPLAVHPSLEIQERSVEFLELMRLAAEAVSGEECSEDNWQVPLLLTQALPSLFAGLELNPVAPGAQNKVPLPDDIDLDAAINPNLAVILRVSELEPMAVDSEFQRFYQQRPSRINKEPSAASRLEPGGQEIHSYQKDPEENYLAAETKIQERRERNKDDPFYIPSEEPLSEASTSLHSILRNSNGNELDIEAIPIMDLDLGTPIPEGSPRPPIDNPLSKRKHGVRKRYDIALDENIASIDSSSALASNDELDRESDETSSYKHPRGKKTLLQVDSSGLGRFSFENGGQGGSRVEVNAIGTQEDEVEMARAMREVERLRLEMQRASERIEAAKEVPPEGTVVKKKKKKKKEKLRQPKASLGEKSVAGQLVGSSEPEPAKVKKKKKKKKVEVESV
ncbi:MAG: hypothetical protein M1819_007363 [Sarea resinae]|nr:MAG: hypothetical protein M1819_007363 [Sarea resinae]